MTEVGLALHPEKTRVVYCQDDNRRADSYEHTEFVFLGYGFRATLRAIKRRGDVPVVPTGDQ